MVPLQGRSGFAPMTGVCRGKTFPAMDVATSFPGVPHPADATARPRRGSTTASLYHNRGDSTFAGESSDLWRLHRLDDLFTERPEVVDGHGRHLQDVGRLRHRRLPDRHGQARQPRVLAEVQPRHPRTEAKRISNDDFFMFGEVYDGPRSSCRSTRPQRSRGRPSTSASSSRASLRQGKPATCSPTSSARTTGTDADSNAYHSPTFLGNHDMGRVAMFVPQGPRAPTPSSCSG